MPEEPPARIFHPARGALIQQQKDRSAVILLCRDITAYAKKIIFAAHRTQPEQPQTIGNALALELVNSFTVVAKALATIQWQYAADANFVNYKSTLSNALEELIEALTFGFYLSFRRVMLFAELHEVLRLLVLSYNDLTQAIDAPLLHHAIERVFCGFNANRVLPVTSPTGTGVDLWWCTMGDYVMGLLDLSGELMRYATVHSRPTDVSHKVSPTSLQIFRDLEALKHAFDALAEANRSVVGISRGQFMFSTLAPPHSVWGKKIEVLAQNHLKVQSLICDMVIRGNERYED